MDVNKHLMTGPKGKSEFFFPETSMSPEEQTNNKTNKQTEQQ